MFCADIPIELDRLIVSQLNVRTMCRVGRVNKTCNSILRKEITDFKNIGTDVKVAFCKSNFKMIRHIFERYYADKRYDIGGDTIGLYFGHIFRHTNAEIYTYVFNWFYRCTNIRGLYCGRETLSDVLKKNERSLLSSAITYRRLDIIKVHISHMSKYFKHNISDMCSRTKSPFWLALLENRIDIVEYLYEIQTKVYNREITFPTDTNSIIHNGTMDSMYVRVIKHHNIKALKWLQAISKENDRLKDFYQSFLHNLNYFYSAELTMEQFIRDVLELCVDLKGIDYQFVLEHIRINSDTYVLCSTFKKIIAEHEHTFNRKKLK